MARLLDLGTLVVRCQQRADREGDDHISPEEWKSLVSEQYGDLYSVVAKAGLQYFQSTQAITATGAASYALAADHFSTIGVDFVRDSAGHRRSLRPLPAQLQARMRGNTGEAFRYAVIGANLHLFPNPSSGSYELRYVPQAPDLAGAASTTDVDVITPDGEAFVLWGVSVKARAKSDEEVQLAIAEREAARVRLATWAALRAFEQPRSTFVDDGDSFGFGYDELDEADWRYR